MSNIFMQIQGIEGNVSVPGYQGWIEVDGLDFGVAREINTRAGKTADRESSLPKFSEVTLVKRQDKASNKLFLNGSTGKAMPKVVIHACYTDAGKLSPYAKYTLYDVMVSSHQTSLSANMVPQETLGLSYTKIERTYINRDKENKAQSPDTVGYDLEQAQPL